MNQFGLLYIYTWKCHKETPCVAILNNEKCHFFLLLFLYKIGEQEGGTGPAWDRGWYQWEGEGFGEMVKESEYGAYTVYTRM
jgi:hypothetical protein